MIFTDFGLHPFVVGKPKRSGKAYRAYIFHDFAAISKLKLRKSLATAYNPTVFFCILSAV